jgi:hypothetical protein
MMLMARSEGDAGADARRVERKVIDVHTGTLIQGRQVWYRRAFAAVSLSPGRLLLPKHRQAPVRAGERR